MTTEVVKVKPKESGEVRKYIDFLLWCRNIFEENVNQLLKLEELK